MKVNRTCGLHMLPFIVQGDKTTHGGTVLAGSPFSDCEGKPIARVGDMVACPKCRGVFPIAEGDQSNNVDGAPVAYHGCKVACGASLISSQVRTLTHPSSGNALKASSDSPEDLLASKSFGAIGAGMAAAYQDARIDDVGDRYRGRFQLVSMEDGKPISGRSIRVRSTDGQYVTGTTDEEGYTQWVEREIKEALAFDLDDGRK